MALFVPVMLLLLTALQTPSSAASADLDWSQLRQNCLLHEQEANTLEGWSPNRFEKCRRQPVHKVELWNTNGAYLGFVEYEIWLLTKADYSSRRVDMQVSIENIAVANQLNSDLVYITVNVGGCAGATFVTCTGETSRTDTAESWYNRGQLSPILATSTNGVGALPYSTVDLVTVTSIQVEYRDGKTTPWFENLATTAARFDSAGPAIGSAPQHGTVLRDYAPTMNVDRGPSSLYRAEAVHVDDALHHPQRTFPSFVGKNVPGENRPLHRLMGTAADKNRDEAKKLCIDIWGKEYSEGGLDCDEFPFRATYEGAYYSTAGVTCSNPTETGPADWRKWNGSARPIDKVQNSQGGTALSAFYRLNRMLDCDAFYVKIVQ